MGILVSRAGLWLVLFLLCFIAMVAAQDSAFAIHMGICSIAALIAMWHGLSRPDYARLARARAPCRPPTPASTTMT